MRCVVRACLIGSCILIAIIYFLMSTMNSGNTEIWDENDDLTRNLLEGVDPIDPKAVSLGSSTSVSVAIVVIVSLVSVSLLVTGIIIIAITVDPMTVEDESDVEWDDPLERAVIVTPLPYPMP